MKVLHICSYYLAITLFEDLCETQRKQGMDVRVFVPVEKGNPSHRTVQDYVDVCPCIGKYDRLIYRLKQRKIFKSIKQQYDFTSFDLTHAHTLFSNGYVSYRLHKKYGIPYVVAVRGTTDVHFFLKKLFWLRPLGMRILRDAAHVVFIAPQGKAQMLANYVPKKLRAQIEAKSTVVPNGLSPFWLENKHKNVLEIHDKRINILTVGNVHKWKNLLNSVEACNELKNRGYVVNHTIIGKVLDNAIANTLRQENSVTLIEAMPKEQLIKHFRKNHIFFLPSVVETFGRVYAEALTQGLPVVYTKGQGFDGFFPEGEVGYAVDSGNIHDMADKLEDIIVHYEKFRTACNGLPDLFDWEQLIRCYADIYEKAKER